MASGAAHQINLADVNADGFIDLLSQIMGMDSIN